LDGIEAAQIDDFYRYRELERLSDEKLVASSGSTAIATLTRGSKFERVRLSVSTKHVSVAHTNRRSARLGRIP